MEDDPRHELEKIRTAIAGLEAQRLVLGEAIVGPALQSLGEKLAALEARLPGPAVVEIRRPEELRFTGDRPEGRCLVTVLFADLVGSTSIAERLDPEDWQEIVARVHTMSGALVQDHQGNVLQYLGDGLVALFGLRASNEGDPENAIRAALAIQAGLPTLEIHPPLQMRIGIHSGWVVMGEMGPEARREYTATGDAMNLAARLQSAAPPQGILVSHDTYRFVRGAFELTPQPLLALKGKSEPVQAYLVGGARPRPFLTSNRGVVGLEIPTVGRDAELDRLRAANLRAVETGSLVWAQLVGEAGMGKSRLLNEMGVDFATSPQRTGLLKARAFPGDENHAFSLVRRMWFDRFGIAEDLPLAEAEARWQAAFLRLHGEPSAGLEEAAQALGLLVGLPFEGSPHLGAQRDDPLQVKGRAFVVSRQLMEVVRSRMQVVIFLEDLHWADPASWEYILEAGAHNPPGTMGVFVLATARPEWRPPKELLELPNYVQIDLAALPYSECRLLVEALLEPVEDVPEEVIEGIVARSEGVPYYAEEMLNLFLDRGVIDRSRLPWRFDASRLKEQPLPATLQHLLHTRLSGLTGTERASLQRGAVFGRRFWEGGLHALGLPSSREALAGLESRNFVHLEPRSTLEGEAEWSFHHNLLHQVTYESALKRERRAWHRQAEAWLEVQARQAGRLDEFVEVLGEHAERAGDLTAAADWYVQAGERAAGRGAPQLARSYFDRALALAPAEDLERRWRILLGRDEVLGVLGEIQARIEDDTALLALAQALGDDRRVAEAYYRQGFFYQNVGDDEAALHALDTGLEAAEGAGAQELHALLLGLKVVSLTRLGDMDGAAQAAQIALSASQGLADGNNQAYVMANAAHYFMAVGDYAQAVQILSQQTDIWRRLGNTREQVGSLANLGYVLVLLGRFGEAVRDLETSLHLAERVGSRRLDAYNRLNLGLGTFRLGQFDAAQRFLGESLEELARLGDQFGQAAGRSYLGLALEGAGQWVDAGRHFTEAEKVFRSLNANGYAADALAGRARCAFRLGEMEEAQQAARQVWNAIMEHGAQGLEFPIWAYQTCAEVLAGLGEEVLSRQIVEAGVQELMQRAGKISDPEWRRSWLENIPEHRAILERQARQGQQGKGEAGNGRTEYPI